MIEISEPRIERKDGKSYLICNIKVPKEATEKWKEISRKCDSYTYLTDNYSLPESGMDIWYKVDEEYEKYFITEANDGFVVGMLYYAMTTGQDIVSKAPISKKLMFNLNYILIPTLCNKYSGFKRIFIRGRGTNIIYDTAQKRGTGMSCGIDSLYTVYSLNEQEYVDETYKLNCLTFIDAGASHYVPHIDPKSGISTINEEANKIHANKLDRAKSVARDLEVPLIEIRSNISDLYQGLFSPSHIYRNISAILCLQKYFEKYYYSSSGLPINEYTPSLYEDPAHAEQLVIHTLSTETMEIICSGISRTRAIKIEELLNDKITRLHLNVCNLDENCGHCSKCYRTLLMLDIFDRLEEFKEVFNIKEYKNNKKKAYLWLTKNQNNDYFANEIYKEAKKKNLIPIWIDIVGKTYSLLKSIKRKMFR